MKVTCFIVMDLQRVKGGGERSVPGWVSCLVQVNVQSHWGSTYSIQEHHELLVCLFAPASLVAYSVGARRNAEISWVSSVSQACSKKGQFKQRLSRKCWFVWIFFWGGVLIIRSLLHQRDVEDFFLLGEQGEPCPESALFCFKNLSIQFFY